MSSPRPTSTATIAFGLVAIPVRTYTATSSLSVSFNTLHRECGTRVKQSLVCPECGDTHGDTVKGLPASDGRVVAFEAAELAALESPRLHTIEVAEFVPLAAVDPIYIDRATYIGPNKGADKAFVVFVRALERAGLVAIGRYHARGKTAVVMLRALQGRLCLHYLHFAGEVRAISEIDAPSVHVPEREQALADQLVAALRSDTFDPTQYRDEYSDRVRAAADAKAAGLPVATDDARPDAQIIDLMEALRQSMQRRAEGG